MPSFCAVSSCEFKYSHSENVSFHKFPFRSKSLLTKWIEFADRGPSWRPSRWSAICSRHFLPSDFRDMSSRKCLKKSAVPSVSIKPFVGNISDLQNENEDSTTYEICRLCGLNCRPVALFTTNFEIYSMIQKCLPALNVQLEDNLPKSLCLLCVQRLQDFSDFVDTVLRVQSNLGEIDFLKSNTSKGQIPNTERILKIKQEPQIKVKQELSDTTANNDNYEFDSEFQTMGPEFSTSVMNDDDENNINIEQKSIQNNGINSQQINTQDIISNCDVMEVVSLDDPSYIDIADDEVTDEQTVPLDSKIDLHAMKLDVEKEHNYTKDVFSDPNEKSKRDYKIEKAEDTFDSVNSTHELPTKSNKDIIVLNESIVQQPIQINSSIFKCNDCPLQFLTEIALNNHCDDDHHISIVQEQICSKCPSSFSSVYNLLKHKNEAHPKRSIKRSVNIFQHCQTCGKTFASRLAWNNHRKYICINYQNEIHNCKYCSSVYNKWTLLRRHEKNCPKRTRTFHRRSNYIRKNTNIAAKTMENDFLNQYSCSQCGRSYSKRCNLMRHESSHRPKSEWNFKCGDCGKFFDRLHDLRLHLRRQECLKSPVNPEKICYVCTICGKLLKSYQRLKVHTAIHSSKKPFVCECGKAFKCANNLYQHKITHTDVRKYKCDLCEKMFKRKGGLNQHKRAIHLKIKPHECPVCKHRYALKGDMLRCKHSDLNS